MSGQILLSLIALKETTKLFVQLCKFQTFLQEFEHKRGVCASCAT